MWKFILAAFLAFMTLFFFATPFVFFLDPITVGILVVIGAFIIKGKVFSDSDVNSTSSASKRTEEINSQTKKEQSTASQIEENKKVSNRQPKVDFKSGINYGMLTDIDGNIYKTVQIGNQIWMAENLRVSRYRNGDLIPNVTDNEKWGEFETGAWCNYDNNPNLNSEYGKLYNWYAVADSRNIAPAGWHVPTDAEWTFAAAERFAEDALGEDADDTNPAARWLARSRSEASPSPPRASRSSGAWR